MVILVYLVLNHLLIVKRYPLVSVVSVRSNPSLGILNNLPALLDLRADFVVGQETSLSGKLAFHSLLAGRRVEAGIRSVVQSEGLAVERHAHDQFVAWSSLLDPVVHGKVLWKNNE